MTRTGCGNLNPAFCFSLPLVAICGWSSFQLIIKVIIFMPVYHPLQPNEISYNSAIHACGRGGQWELALSLLKEMRELGLSPDRISFGAMVSMRLWSNVDRKCFWPVLLAS